MAAGVTLGSPEALAKPCDERPSASELLYILDTSNYAVSRVQCDCAKQNTRTVGYQSIYRVVGDTVQFFVGDGVEVFMGQKAVVTPDSIITIVGAAPQRLRYVRRQTVHAARQ